MSDDVIVIEAACEHVTMQMGPVPADSWLRPSCPFGCVMVVTELPSGSALGKPE